MLLAELGVWEVISGAESVWNPAVANRYFTSEPKGSYTVQSDGEATTVGFTVEYELKPDAPVSPEEVERQNREELIPVVLAGLKHYVETGEPMQLPERLEA